MAERKKSGVDTMRELRDWLVTKCRIAGLGTSSDQDNDGASSSAGAAGDAGVRGSDLQHQYSSHVVTPKSIPQFVIPGSNDSSRQPSIGSQDDLLSHSSGEPSSLASWSASTSPAVSPRSSFSALTAPESSVVDRVRSCPVSPRCDSHGFLRDFGARSSLSNLPHVHVDQASPTMTVANGHVYPTHSPRKYSGGGSPGGYARLQCPRKGSLTIPSSDFCRPKPRRMHRSFQDVYPSTYDDRSSLTPELLHVTHLTAEFRGNGGACTYTGLTDKNEYLPMKETFRRSKRYYRRRSSLVTSDVLRLLSQHPNLAAGHPRGTSRSSSSLHHSNRSYKQLAPIDPLIDKRHSSPEVRVSVTNSDGRITSINAHKVNNNINNNNDNNDAQLQASRSIDKGRSNSLNSLTSRIPVSVEGGLGAAAAGAEIVVPNLRGKTETERGDVKFSFQYFPATKRLKVILIRAEELRFPEKPELSLNPFFKLCLMPGKLQKQLTETVRQTRAPLLNKEFFFTDLSLEEMKSLRLRIMAFHKAHHLKLPEYLGEVNVPLSNYDLLMENRMWNDLHFKPYKKVRDATLLDERDIESKSIQIIILS
ncbi:synaptotagmin-1 [Plakobranchus ocellatus]|uniref:Synaptotagmin-1 n=1 Tax=Plakobranchus ocellatus TaxID=259542 RepID=A0AAV4AC70_9GAST|nr:synaptotagmin-1 [Plakobranchus ocellatus]